MREAQSAIKARLFDRLGPSNEKVDTLASMKAWTIGPHGSHAFACHLVVTVKGAGVLAAVCGDVPTDEGVEQVTKALGGTMRFSGPTRCDSISISIQHPYSGLLDLAAAFEGMPVRRASAAQDRKYFFEATAVGAYLRTAFRALATRA